MELKYKPNSRKKTSIGLAIGAVAIASSMLFSCSKVNDQIPFSKLTPEEAFSTPERIEKSAIGMYDALQNGEFLGGRVLIYSDVRSVDVNISSLFW
ncbi:hypothetical protein QFZ51_005422 [Chitinophaga sp. W3I9]|uniref:hypothetical protein n=1 Tax=Chitinophaga sp. W3I9 TaxID=3373924 RepID=UPI003D261282